MTEKEIWYVSLSIRTLKILSKEWDYNVYFRKYSELQLYLKGETPLWNCDAYILGDHCQLHIKLPKAWKHAVVDLLPLSVAHYAQLPMSLHFFNLCCR
jgi:hypothetical protein